MKSLNGLQENNEQTTGHRDTLRLAASFARIEDDDPLTTQNDTTADATDEQAKTATPRDRAAQQIDDGLAMTLRLFGTALCLFGLFIVLMVRSVLSLAMSLCSIVNFGFQWMQDFLMSRSVVKEFAVFVAASTSMRS